MTSQFLGKDQPVDMSDLISFSMGFSKLGLVLGDVVSRLGNLEKKVNDPDANPTGAAAPAIGEDSRPDRVNRAAPTTGAARPDEAAATESAATGSKPRTGSANPTTATNDAADAPSGAAPNGMVAVPASDLAALTKRVKALEDEVDALRSAGDRRLPGANGAGEAVEADAAKQAPAGDAKDAEARAKAAEASAKDADARAKAAERTAQDALELAKSAGEKADAVSDRLSKQLRQQGPAAVDNSTAATAANAGAPNANSAAMDDLADQLAQLSKAVDKVANQQRGQAGDIAALNEAVHHPSRSNSGAAPATGAPSATSAPADVVARIAALEDAVKKSSGADAPTTGASNGGSGGTKGDHAKDDAHQGASKAAPPSDSTLRDAIRAMEDRVTKLESAAPSNHPAGVGATAPGGVGASAGAGSVGDKAGDRAIGKLPASDQQLKDLAAQVAELQKRLNGQVPVATEVAGVHTADPVDKSFAPPSAGLELERLQSQMKQLAGDVDALKQRASAGGSNLAPAPAATEATSPAGDFGDLPHRVDALQRALDDLNERVAGLPAPGSAALGPHVGGEPSTEVANEAARAAHDARAASEAADQALKRLGEMNDGQDALRKKIQQIEAALAALPSAGAGGDVSGTPGVLAPVSVEDAVKKVLADRDQAALKAGLAPATGAAAAPDGATTAPTEMQQSLAHQVLDIRATVDHLIHGKADAAQVANKAERDYVEGALEKLMQEVERVINITNASLIDTLDKSLGLLRDMIDGKATKADLAKARLLGTQGAAGNSGLDTQQVPDGLIGFKSYRCLGCNRTVEAMRVRPMGSSAQAFSAKLPPSATTRQPKPPALSASLPALTAPLPPMPPSSA